MKLHKLLLLTLVCFKAHATIALVGSAQHGTTSACTTATCVATISSTGAGHLGVFTFIVPAAQTTATVSSITDSAGSTWVNSTGCLTSGTLGFPTRCGYSLSLLAGATTVTLTMSASPVTSMQWSFIEYSTTLPPFLTDTVGVTNTTTCTTCTGVTLTLGGTNDVIVQTAASTGNVSAVSAPYTNPADVVTGSGYAGSINTVSGTAPTWTVAPTSVVQETGIAFKESPKPPGQFPRAN